MRARVANWILYIFIAVLAVTLLALPFHAFISTWGGTAAGPLLVWKSWKEILLLAVLPLAITYLFLRSDVAKVLWARWINKLIAFYFLLHVALAVISPASSNAVLAGLAFNLRFLGIFLLAQMVVASATPLVHKFKKLVMPWLLVATVLISLMAIAQVALLPKEFLTQFGYDKNTTIAPYVLIDQNPDAVRAFATLRGPNELGSYLLLPLAVALVVVIGQRRNILAGAALGLGGVALALTGSRSAWLGAVVMLVTLLVLWLPPKRLAKVAVWGGVPALLVGGLFLLAATAVPSLRLAVFHSSPGDSSLFEGSSEKHWQASYDGARDALDHPLGQGVGTAGPASFYGDSPKIAENYFVQLAQEVGLAGVVLFVAINLLLAAQLWRTRRELWAKLLLASLVGLTTVNLFLHGWVDDPTAMTWWLIAGLYAFVPQQQPKKRSSIRTV